VGAGISCLAVRGIRLTWPRPAHPRIPALRRCLKRVEPQEEAGRAVVGLGEELPEMTRFDCRPGTWCW
jgi:hypothetical protein